MAKSSQIGRLVLHHSKITPISDCGVLGTDENILENETFVISPNPAAEILNISFMNNQNSKQTVFIFNAIGQLYKTSEVLQSQQIDISDLPSGLYFVRLPNYFSQSQKFIKH